MLSTFIELIPTSLLQGLILGFVTLGVFIPFRLLNFSDLTAEGSYPLGGIVCGTFLLLETPPALAILGAVIAAGCLGICTAFIHLRFKVNTLLAGIILSTMIYSINLRLMGKPNIALFDSTTLFSSALESIGLQIMGVLILSLLAAGGLLLFLLTTKGLAFRAVGLNPQFAQRQGINLTKYTVLGLFLGNGLCGLGGSLMVQTQSYADIGMGVGIVIHALASMMIGEALLGNATLLRQIISPLVGALIYQQVQGLALAMGLPPSDLKFLTGGILLGVIALTNNNPLKQT